MAEIWDQLLNLVANNQAQPYWGGLSFTPEMESKFQNDVKNTKWYQQFIDKFGKEPNLDTTDYNTRRAWFSGVMPQDSISSPDLQHWSSSTPEGGHLKSANHPTEWMNNYMQMTGKDPMAVQEDIYKRLLGVIK